ncbi:hypothetical protein BPOR_0255g00120 [Botrytis porri]|uniref:Uncharacterized protein n=1 Tax=Botrytis porri TaxID=87229 RepID=A0A4Z1KLV7_9HELO|nr:hypothetical protein BPOR_0255g00120 [Botrytis porri]
MLGVKCGNEYTGRPVIYSGTSESHHDQSLGNFIIIEVATIDAIRDMICVESRRLASVGVGVGVGVGVSDLVISSPPATIKSIRQSGA